MRIKTFECNEYKYVFKIRLKYFAFKIDLTLTSISSLDNKSLTISWFSFSTAICNAVLSK